MPHFSSASTDSSFPLLWRFYLSISGALLAVSAAAYNAVSGTTAGVAVVSVAASVDWRMITGVAAELLPLPSLTLQKWQNVNPEMFGGIL